jgi:hypothetical protein
MNFQGPMDAWTGGMNKGTALLAACCAYAAYLVQQWLHVSSISCRPMATGGIAVQPAAAPRQRIETNGWMPDDRPKLWKPDTTLSRMLCITSIW